VFGILLAHPFATKMVANVATNIALLVGGNSISF